MKSEVTINYDKIYETARKGINRAAIFMGLGVNAADSENLDEYILDKYTRFQILPQNVPEHVLKDWKEEFKIWTVGCGFREVIERYCVFLDQIYHASSLIKKSFTPESQKKFEHFGLEKKIRKLKEEFGIGCRYPDELITIYLARNCYAHRLGKVGDRDLNGKPQFKIKWFSFKWIFTPEKGEMIDMPNLLDPESEAFVAPEKGMLGIQWIIKELAFEKGRYLKISPKELTEILFFVSLMAQNFIKASLNYAKESGIELKKKSN